MLNKVVAGDCWGIFAYSRSFNNCGVLRSGMLLLRAALCEKWRLDEIVIGLLILRLGNHELQRVRCRRDDEVVWSGRFEPGPAEDIRDTGNLMQLRLLS